MELVLPAVAVRLYRENAERWLTQCDLQPDPDLIERTTVDLSHGAQVMLVADARSTIVLARFVEDKAVEVVMWVSMRRGSLIRHLENLIEIAQSSGVTRIDLEAKSSARKRLYSRFGFVPTSGDCMSRDI